MFDRSVSCYTGYMTRRSLFGLLAASPIALGERTPANDPPMYTGTIPAGPRQFCKIMSADLWIDIAAASPVKWVQQHDGSVRLQSEGTSFKLYGVSFGDSLRLSPMGEHMKAHVEAHSKLLSGLPTSATQQ